MALTSMQVRLTGRRDGLLLGGLAIALLTTFDRSIGWVFAAVRDVEISYGVRLLPALVVLIAIFMAHLYIKREDSRNEARAAELAARLAQERLRELEELHGLAGQLATALSTDAIRAALWRHLPNMTHERDAWVTLWIRDGVEILVDTAGCAERLESHTRQLLDQWRNERSEKTLRRVGEECCFPLVVAGQAIGVLGVSERTRAMTASTESVLTAAAALLAAAVRTVQLLTELRETAVLDSLTGCVNRAHFVQAMTAELRRTRRTESPLSLLMIDLDGFKQLNDRHGHLAGDAALAAFGRRTRELLRHSDVRCRYGGDEFLILLADTAITGALHVAEVLRREIAALDLRPSGDPVTITASVGVATAIPGEIDPTLCIERADRALYAAKRAGGNRVMVEESAPSLSDMHALARPA
jgi:diguanylate cyclase (GGDEF)-like protein